MQAAALETVILKEQDPALRQQCIEPLRQLGGAAVPALLLELKDTYRVLAQEAEQAILQMGPEAVPELEKAMATTEEGEHWRGLSCLAGGGRRPYPTLPAVRPLANLEAVGAKLTTLTKEQAEYIGVDVAGPYKPDQYRY